jgi:hypothetical protein
MFVGSLGAETPVSKPADSVETMAGSVKGGNAESFD